MTRLTRRTLLGATAILPFSLTLGTAPAPARAEGKASSPVQPRARGIKLGDMTVTALLDRTDGGARNVQETYGLNVSAETFAAVAAENFLPTDMGQSFFTPTLVESGDNTVLIDTGTSAASITEALAAAGKTPDDITHVIITHFHGDHVSGLMQDGQPTFGNAQLITGQAEFDYWAREGDEDFDAFIKPLQDRFSFASEGTAVVPGVETTELFGHTPGMLGTMLSSGTKSMMIISDMTNHPVFSLAHPDWEVRWDMDKKAAAATRRRVLGMLADEKMPMQAFHFSFPAMGYVARRGEGFVWVPESYQLML